MNHKAARITLVVLELFVGLWAVTGLLRIGRVLVDAGAA
jgi:hypothetical protein